MSQVRCPHCGAGAWMVSPDWGFGRGSEWQCAATSAGGCGRFKSKNLPRDQEAVADAHSSSSIATSAANARKPGAP